LSFHQPETYRVGPPYVDTTSGVHGGQSARRPASACRIREPCIHVANQFDYRFRPDAGPLVAWGPSVHTDWVWSHDGTRLDLLTDPSLNFRFKGQSVLALFPYTDFHEQLRPIDFPALAANHDYHEHNSSVIFGTSYLKWLLLQGYYQWEMASTLFLRKRRFWPRSGCRRNRLCCLPTVSGTSR
jgi:hypothetical protein